MRTRALGLVALALAACAGTPPPPVPGPEEPVAQDRLRDVVEMLSEGDIAELYAQFDPRMTAAITPEQLGQVWASTIVQFGEYQSLDKLESAEQQGLRTATGVMHFANGAVDIRLALNAEGKIAGLFLTPRPAALPRDAPPGADTTRFTERAVTVGPLALPGTLTIPEGAGPFPGVVLVQGSGPHDRNETIGPNQPFRDLAWQLATRGIAVLRYDKRTLVHPESFAGRPYTVKEEVVDDAVTAVELLRHELRVDSSAVFVLGHSLGGMLAPRIGARDANVAGLILLAGPARPLQEYLPVQARFVARASGDSTVEDNPGVQAADSVVARIAALQPGDSLSMEPIALVPASYWLDLRDYYPPELAKRLDKPFLVLQGGRDFQIPPSDLDLWRQALAGKPGTEFHLYPALNHLFIPGEGPPSLAEYQQPGHVPARVADDIAAWIRARAD
ncbi:MAG TPA: alpha/beta fold hydrolase [Longimicrobiaceae bacterium]|nr:alpha/beta fold hydrolase [Longimicrobiaceae bacterium]